MLQYSLYNIIWKDMWTIIQDAEKQDSYDTVLPGSR